MSLRFSISAAATTIAAAAGLATLAIPSQAHADEQQALVVPLSGEVTGPLEKAPTRFRYSLEAIIAERGARPIAAEVSRQELSAIAGCDDDSDACLASIAEAMGVSTVVVGEINQLSESSLEISLTVGLQEGTRRGTIEIQTTDIDRAAAEFARQARGIIEGEPVTPLPDETADRPPDPPPPQPRPSPAAFDFGRVKPYSYAVAGGGLALLGAGALFYALAADKQSEVDDAPTETLEDLRRLEDLESTGERYALFGNIATIAGGAAAAAGVALIVIQGTRKEAPPAATVTPVALRGGGLGLTVTFRGDL